MKEIRYNQDHMKEIAEKYDQCVEVIIQALTCHDRAKVAMLDNYEGQAADVVAEIFDKLKQHILLLEACCKITADYVRDSLEDVKEVDKKVLDKVKGGV